MVRSIVLAAAMLAMASACAATKVQIAEGESVMTLRIDSELTIDPAGQVREYKIRTKPDPKLRELVNAWLLGSGKVKAVGVSGLDRSELIAGTLAFGLGDKSMIDKAL